MNPLSGELDAYYSVKNYTKYFTWSSYLIKRHSNFLCMSEFSSYKWWNWLMEFLDSDYLFLYAFMLSRLSCVWLLNCMICSRPGSSVHGILQARILEWVARPSSRRSSQTREQIEPTSHYVFCTAVRFFITSTTCEAVIYFESSLNY